MLPPRIAIVSFPGNNGDTENVRCFARNGFHPFVFRWNDDVCKLEDVEAYFIGAGFSYEDRGRAGMVAARDPLFQFLREEAERGKVIIGHCNGAQVLVESGLIPLGRELRMSLARNAVQERATGFLNEWIWMKRTCKKDRCCTADWDDVMHIPIAHAEGRFVTKDPELIAELEANDQIAFRYCSEDGTVSTDPSVTLNGSTDAIAGICNKEGNVVAIMPHAERTENGDPYFQSVLRWMDKRTVAHVQEKGSSPARDLLQHTKRDVEIFVDTKIVNNEERTVEQAAKRVNAAVRLKQFRYLAPTKKRAEEVLTTIALFNPNKEKAYVRKGGEWYVWQADEKKLEGATNPLTASVFLRRDEPDTNAASLGSGSETGICYALSGVSDDGLRSAALQEIFANPHASTLKQYV